MASEVVILGSKHSTFWAWYSIRFNKVVPAQKVQQIPICFGASSEHAEGGNDFLIKSSSLMS